jgi:hypothetical protein
MSKRRSLDDALTPEEESFLVGSPPSANPLPSEATEPPHRPAQSSVPKTRPSAGEEGVQTILRSTSAESRLPPAVPEGGLVALNTRIDPTLAAALLRASIERKIQRIEPFTQRDIVSAAIRFWLNKCGYTVP